MNNIGKQSYVVVKVSSAAVHNTVMKPSALEAIFQKLKCKALSDVLIGVWRPSPSNLVTIMKDLRKDHYRSLEPDKIPDVTVLWNSFATLVKELLLPFARQGVVHCGIRPGWDHTASLMWNNNAGEGIQLRLIDYESLCMVKDAHMVPVDKKCFHIKFSSNPDEREDAFVFLWWQCFFVANAWFKHWITDELSPRQFVTDCRSGDLSGCFHGSLDETDETFLRECAVNQKITEKTVMKSLHIFEMVFDFDGERRKNRCCVIS